MVKLWPAPTGLYVYNSHHTKPQGYHTMTTRNLLTIVFCSVAISWHATARAEVGSGMMEKGAHGLVNIGTCWIELPMQVCKGYDRGINAVESPALSRSVGAVVGIFRGVSHGAGRAGVGIYQLGGFWTASPHDNHGIGTHFDGEYSYQRGEDEGLSLDGTVDAMVAKAERGIFNIVACPAAIPNEIHGTGNPSNSLIRGGWFTVSRLWSGIYELGTFVLPNERYTYGHSFGDHTPLGN